MKKFTAVLFALCLAISLFSVSAFAADENSIQDAAKKYDVVAHLNLDRGGKSAKDLLPSTAPAFSEASAPSSAVVEDTTTEPASEETTESSVPETTETVSTPKATKSVADTGDAGIAAAAAVSAVAAAAFVLTRKH